MLKFQETISLRKNKFKSIYFVSLEHVKLSTLFDKLKNLAKKFKIGHFELSRRTLNEMFADVSVHQIMENNLEDEKFEVLEMSEDEETDQDQESS